MVWMKVDKYLNELGFKKAIQDLWTKIKNELNGVPKFIRVENEEDAILLSVGDTKNIYFVTDEEPEEEIEDDN